MAFPGEPVEQRRGVIPRRVRVMAQSCGVRALNAHAREREWGRRACGGPRARRTSPEGAFRYAALAGRGGRQGGDRVVRVF
jgi:hypothetical protein